MNMFQSLTGSIHTVVESSHEARLLSLLMFQSLTGSIHTAIDKSLREAPGYKFQSLTGSIHTKLKILTNPKTDPFQSLTGSIHTLGKWYLTFWIV
jgi:hypothetical protein